MGLEDKIDINVPTIPEYYRDKTIFITGGSGFMGQALVEKLLYSCPELDRIYLLMRQKRGVPPEERLEELYSSSCFDRLRDENPSIFKNKVHILSGDVLELGLGLSEQDKNIIIDKVNVVFHVAASVRFDDSLQYAAKLNIRGTREMIELAKQIKDLSSFVHVSTCYSNTNHDVIDEVLYPPLADWRELLEACETVDEMTLQSLTAKYLNGMPNTYVFTKQLAEHLVSEQRGRLPVVIIRPSIVMSSIEEPAPGWNNSLNGPIGISLAIATGLKRCVYGSKNAVVNYVPLDVCIKSFAVIAWARGIVKIQDTDDVQIFNCCVSHDDAINLKDYSDISMKITHDKYPLHTVVWHPKAPIYTDVFTFFFFMTLFYNILPAIIIDPILMLFGKKARFLTLQRKIYISDLVLHYYIAKKWILKNERFLKVRQSIKEQDKKAFYYSSEKLYESDYLERCVVGAKKYLLKEDVNDMSQAKANAFRMKVLDRAVKVVFFGCILWLVVNSRLMKSQYEKLYLTHEDYITI